MNIKKIWSILFMLVIVLGTAVSFTSCGDDNDDMKPGSSHNNSDKDDTSSSSGDNWNTSSSMRNTVKSYYVGTWYKLDQFSTFLVYQLQGYSEGMKNVLHDGLEFNSDGTGYEVYYRNGSSTASKTPFTWSVLKTLRPGSDYDCLTIKFQNHSADNIVIVNSARTNMSNVDRQMFTVSIERGVDDYVTCNMWDNYVRYTGYTLRW